MTTMISRREFIKSAGLRGAGMLLSGLESFSKVAAKVDAPKKWPWPYEKLDPKKRSELAYEEWCRIFCGGAVISSIFKQLSEKIGYKSFPVDSFIVLEGGMAGWGTICGFLAGANIVTNVIIGPRIARPDCEHGHVIGSNIMNWYSNTKLPIYVPKNPRANKDGIVQTVSNSPLCHICWKMDEGC